MKAKEIIESWYQDVQQELNRQMEEIKTEISDKSEVLAPLDSQEKINRFVGEQEKHYAERFTDDFGQLTVMPFSWDNGRYGSITVLLLRERVGVLFGQSPVYC